MALFDRFRKKTKEAEVQKIEKEKSEERPKKEEFKKEETEKIRQLTEQKKIPQAYRVIREPHITEKATFLTDQNKYVFKISPEANKVEVKKTIEALYGVKVEKVNLIHMAPKKRRLGRTEGWRHGLKKGFKKAIVTLAKGEKIELLPK